MSRQRTPQPGEGTAWVVFDRIDGSHLCYWYVGPAEDRLAEHARVPTAAEGVAWGRARTPRVRIRAADSFTYWAGTAPTPEGYWRTWTGGIDGIDEIDGIDAAADQPTSGSAAGPASSLGSR